MNDKVERFFERARPDLGAAMVGSLLAESFYIVAGAQTDGRILATFIVATTYGVMANQFIVKPALDKKYG